MDGHAAPQSLLGAPTAPRRNHYYYAKMMDVLHFQMEQTYGQEMRWLGNRLTVGSGVLCGLDVTVEDGQLCVAPGVAIDPLGREIVVPVKTCLDPQKLHDPCGGPAPDPADPGARVLTLSVCYRECLTDYAPVLVSDCQTKEPCAPGTVVETFGFVLQKGPSDPPTLGLCKRCGAKLFPEDRSTGDAIGFEAGVVKTVRVGGAPRAVAASPDGRVAVVANDQRGAKVQVLDVETFGVVQLSPPEIVAPVGGVSFAPDGGPAFVTSAAGVAVIDVSGTRPKLDKALLRTKKYGRCAAAAGGRLLFAIDSGTRNVDVIDVAAGKLRQTIDVRGQASDVAVSSDGLRLYVTDSKNQRVTERLVADLGQVRDLGGFQKGDEQDGALAVRTVTVGFEPLVARGAELRIVRADGAEERSLAAVDARDVAVSSDGMLLYLVSNLQVPRGRRNELVIYEAKGFRELARLEVGREASGVAVVPGRARAFVTNSRAGSVSVVDGRVVREEPPPLDRRRLLCECTAGPCPAPTDGCVPLAVLALGQDGKPSRVETCAVRKRLYSNEMLLELIWCLAERLDECCRPRSAPDTDQPEPGHTPRRPAAREGEST
jgi:DNA-binding beta-propeller fold protein YncE